MNTFLTQAQAEISSEDFQAEAKLALQFFTKLVRVLLLILIGLGLSTFIIGVRSQRFVTYVYNLYFPNSASEYINVIFEDKIKLAKVLIKIKYYQVHSVLVIKSTYNQLVNYLQPVISFVKGLLSNGNSKSENTPIE